MFIFGFIKKPFELEEVVATVRNAARTNALEQRVAYLSDHDRRRIGSHLIVESAVMRDLVREITVVATNPVPVLAVCWICVAGTAPWPRSISTSPGKLWRARSVAKIGSGDGGGDT